MKIRLGIFKPGVDDRKRVLRAVRAIENFRRDWLEDHDTTHKSVASTGIVVARRKKLVRGRYLRYAPAVSEQGESYKPAVVDAMNGSQEILQLGDDGRVLYYAFGSDTPQEMGLDGLRRMAERLEWLVRHMRRHPAACSIDGYSLHTPHHPN